MHTLYSIASNTVHENGRYKHSESRKAGLAWQRKFLPCSGGWPALLCCSWRKGSQSSADRVMHSTCG